MKQQWHCWCLICRIGVGKGLPFHRTAMSDVPKGLSHFPRYTWGVFPHLWLSRVNPFRWNSFCITKIWSVSQEGRSHQSRIFSIFVSSNLIWRFLSFYKIFVVYSRFSHATQNGQQKNGAAKDWPKINGIFWFVSMMLRFSGWLKAIKNNIYMQLMLKYSF